MPTEATRSNRGDTAGANRTARRNLEGFLWILRSELVVWLAINLEIDFDFVDVGGPGGPGGAARTPKISEIKIELKVSNRQKTINPACERLTSCSFCSAF